MALVAFTLTSYGGIRSPDSEVVYRTAEALANRGSFAVEKRLETWPSFGLAPGRDGALYSVFGPLESVALVPFVKLGESLTATGSYDGESVPISHFLGLGAFYALKGEPPPEPRLHAARWPAAWFNILVSALGVLAFFQLVCTLTQHRWVGLTLAVLFAFGTPVWAYSGTFFSEPLATLLLLLSIQQLIRPYELRDESSSPAIRALASGALLGLAILTHITAALFVPFFLLYLVLERKALQAPHRSGRVLAGFLVGCGVIILLLGIFNFARFGDPLETGRGIDPALMAKNGYGTFVAPWNGLIGLLISPGKGLFLYIPAVLLGIALWPRFHRRHPSLSWALGMAALSRLLVIASRSDWHGGLALGPRLLLLAVPIAILPIGSWLADELEQGSTRSLRLLLWLTFALAIQQLYFALGEVFVFLHAQQFKARSEDRFFDVLFDWANSPMLHSLDYGVGPFLLKPIPLYPEVIWLAGAVLIGIGLILWGRFLVRESVVD